MNSIIVSLGIGGIYPKLLERLRESCVKFGAVHRLWNSYPPDARPHSESPYGFKLYAIRQALQEGFKTIVWADSAAYIVKNPNPFFQMVKDKGILFLGHGDKLHRYVNDRSLDLFGFKRDDMKSHWLVSGTVFGFDFTHKIANDFFEELIFYEKNNWFRVDGQKPKGDFLTHRHDEAIIGLMLVKYGIEDLNAYDYMNGGGESVIFRAGKNL